MFYICITHCYNIYIYIYIRHIKYHTHDNIVYIYTISIYSIYLYPYTGGSINWKSPIAGCFKMENTSINGWFRDISISSNLHISIYILYTHIQYIIGLYWCWYNLLITYNIIYIYTICSMYGIFTIICPRKTPSYVGKYTIHGTYGYIIITSLWYERIILTMVWSVSPFIPWRRGIPGMWTRWHWRLHWGPRVTAESHGEMMGKMMGKRWDMIIIL